MSELQTIIEEAFERRADITPRNIETLCRDAILEAIECLKTALEKHVPTQASMNYYVIFNQPNLRITQLMSTSG